MNFTPEIRATWRSAHADKAFRRRAEYAVMDGDQSETGESLYVDNTKGDTALSAWLQLAV